jgi:DNA-binding beta-propeller fold protein YncE
MHPETYQLAAYLDGALDKAAHAAVRAHVLTCPSCTTRLERLREDARRVAAFGAAGPAPDVRAAVRARLRRGSPAGWLLRGGALAGAAAALFLFALLIGFSSGTVARTPKRLFVADERAGQLLALDAESGALLSRVAVGGEPSQVRYDQQYARLYVLLEQAVAVVDTRTLTVTNRWEAPQQFGAMANMALDDRRGRLYVANPAARSIDVLDTATLTPTGSFQLGGAPDALALAPDGSVLFALDGNGVLWTIDPRSGTKSSQSLNAGGAWQRGWLAISPDGGALYVLRYGAPSTLRRIDVRSGQIGAPVALAAGPQPQDMLLLDDGRLAIARGDSKRGGVAIVRGDDFSIVANPDPDYDQHRLAAGPQGTIFALNWLYSTITCYDLGANTRVWQAKLQAGGSSLPRQQPYPSSGVFVPGGWRWPW